MDRTIGNAILSSFENLWPIILFVLLAGILLEIVKKRKRRGKVRRSRELMNEQGAYISKSHFMTPREREFFKLLEGKYGDDHVVFAQVRVVDVIRPNEKKFPQRSKEYLSLFRQLSQWHFDYLICKKGTLEICFAIELDDPTHKKEERKERDKVLECACDNAGLRLVRHNKQE